MNKSVLFFKIYLDSDDVDSDGIDSSLQLVFYMLLYCSLLLYTTLLYICFFASQPVYIYIYISYQQAARRDHDQRHLLAHLMVIQMS